MSDQENGREGHHTPAAQPNASAASVPAIGAAHVDDSPVAGGDSHNDHAASTPSEGAVPIVAPAADPPPPQLHPWLNLPPELRQRAQWQVAGPDAHGKLKRPMSINFLGQVVDGSSTNRATWLTFEYAMAWALYLGWGIGYVLAFDDPFTCIDLDVKDDTPPERIDLFRRITEATESYAELSQSGRGVHIWCVGKVGQGRKRDGVEVYSQERFIACTGRAFQPLPVQHRQQFLDNMVSQMGEGRPALHSLVEMEQADADDVLLERANRAANAEKFQMLWGGKWEGVDEYPSQSEADLALMAILCFYSRSNAQCRRLFRQSELGKRKKASKNDRYLDLTLMKVRGRMAREEDERAQVRFEERKKFQAIGHGEVIDPTSLVPPNMSLDLMRDALVFVDDGRFIAFRDNPLVMRAYQDMKALLRPCKTKFTVLTEKGVKEVVKETFEMWMDSPTKRAVNTVTFDPGAGEFCGTTKGERALNLYRPKPHTVPSDWQTRVQPFLDHVAFLVPVAAERERFLDWLAHIEQQPGVLPHHGYLMIAPVEGIGRNTLADMLACVWSGHVALSLDLGAVLKDQFNDELSRKFLAVVDEINEGAQGAMWTLAEKLKTFITSSVRNMNPKFGRRYMEVNCARLLIFSNHESALPLRATDRRLNVIRNPSSPRDSAYYADLRKHIKDRSFIASIREWFRQRDISAFNPGERAVMNEAKAAVVEATRSEAEDRALELVQIWPCDVITAKVLGREIYGDQYTSVQEGKLGNRAREAGMTKARGPTGKGTGRIRINGHQETIWIIRNHERWAHADNAALVRELDRPPSMT